MMYKAEMISLLFPYPDFVNSTVTKWLTDVISLSRFYIPVIF